MNIHAKFFLNGTDILFKQLELLSVSAFATLRRYPTPTIHLFWKCISFVKQIFICVATTTQISAIPFTSSQVLKMRIIPHFFPLLRAEPVNLPVCLFNSIQFGTFIKTKL